MATITANRLRELREQKGLSQGDVAKLINVTRTAYAAYETGQNKPTRKLQELSDLFGVSADYILGNDKTEPEIKYSADEQRLIEVYRKLDDRGKENMFRNAKGELDMLRAKGEK